MDTRLCRCRQRMRIQRERTFKDGHTLVVETLWGCENCSCARVVKRSKD